MLNGSKVQEKQQWETKQHRNHAGVWRFIRLADYKIFATMSFATTQYERWMLQHIMANKFIEWQILYQRISNQNITQWTLPRICSTTNTTIKYCAILIIKRHIKLRTVYFCCTIPNGNNTKTTKHNKQWTIPAKQI